MAQLLHSPAGSSGRVRVHVVVAGLRRGGRPAPAPRRRARSALVHDHRPADQRLAAGPSSWATSSTVPPFADELAQRLGERLLAGRVHPGGRLVEHQQLGLAGQGAGDQGALLLAAGEGGDRVAGPVGEPDARAAPRVDRGPVGRRRAGAARPGGPAARRPTTSRDGGRHAAAGAEALRDVADPVPTAGTGAAAGAEERRPRRRPSGTSPSTARIRVDLPEPLAPSTATTSPAVTVSETSRSTGRPS